MLGSNTDEKHAQAVLDGDVTTTVCLRGMVVAWIKWNDVRENGARNSRAVH